MKLRTTVTLAIAVFGALASLLVGTGTADAASAHTVVSVLRPVTAHGHAAPGYHASNDPWGNTADCDGHGYNIASPAAVNRNIDLCSPSAVQATACWKSATPHRVLCLDDPVFNRSRHLTSFPLTGRFTAGTPVRVKLPFVVHLTNGTACSLRNGGAGPRLNAHPTWVAWYYCQHNLAIWGSYRASTPFNKHTARWSVTVAGERPTSRPSSRTVAQAWYVGTHS